MVPYNETMLPTLFISHGAPTYAMEPGLAAGQLRALGRALALPQAVLVVSAHWETSVPRVAVTSEPRTVYDFGGFSPELRTITYPATGHPRLAQRTVAALRAAGWPAEPDHDQGMDHGTWVPLRYLFPQANVPVFQVSLPTGLTAASAYAYGAALAPIREHGVLVVGSGSLTHNLQEFRHAEPAEAAYAKEFVDWIQKTAASGDVERLCQAMKLAPHARRAHPTDEHFLPLLVAAGAAGNLLPMTVLPGGIRYGVISMESYVFGASLDSINWAIS